MSLSMKLCRVCGHPMIDHDPLCGWPLCPCMVSVKS